jgi:hypothetical protein
LISQDNYHIEHYARQAEWEWLFTEARGLQGRISIDSIGCVLGLDEVYERVDVGEEEGS